MRQVSIYINKLSSFLHAIQDGAQPTSDRRQREAASQGPINDQQTVHGKIACEPKTTPALRINHSAVIKKKDTEQLCVVVSRALQLIDSDRKMENYYRT